MREAVTDAARFVLGLPEESREVEEDEETVMRYEERKRSSWEITEPEFSRTGLD